ncbi:hypothetical protein COW36_20565 [bacterium (Candidatus Blackallbacteria) CG17_big_fil_post_rev_8_21_14_2_50_48_46]|uniref:Uncharacterized protein n=1 Tax=bacterium (Candidatus Blackallbacteria) CG17_big_fil_post_rev_8_21_14_2_50_48_46 TaxID=2014261 RepID=A0A2M7G068_9BACT|nr:MAG: hypothetical protein COW64_22890 [bacterium (Candidatus Blackallbacteria) CG18_big_fil_WC_8_21_14_2_50_49_26]PIW14799.1 MAG: hypothetical protein COW36_20565 [bacterium (Candidatus Blackallbacteria) CG17_big_fil_post_rev_8_21_14_2_50_48_46]PIW50901.1 MAG: hypothetical protein COW20_01380 [bacterium (Candidatus Blackallbacteria) CG13_big_fil_rev_8_21_14_2_50_49_14]
MRYAHLPLKTALSLLLISSMAACQIPVNGPIATGQMVFKFQLPEQAQHNFAIQAIPPETLSFEIQISGAGLSEAKIVKVAFTAKESQVSHTVTDLPTGAKTVKILAYDQNKTLATATQDVEITASQTTQAIFELKSNLHDLDLKLPQNPPIEIQTEMKISGDGYLSSATLKGKFLPGNNTLNFKDIPAGNQKLSLTFSLQLTGRTLTSSPLERDLKGNSGETSTLSLSLNQIANAFIPSLLAINPAELKSLINEIPEELMAVLRANAALAALLNTQPSASPTPQSSATPSAQPSPEPTPTPTPQPRALNLEVIDGRVIFRSIQILKENVETLVGATADRDVVLLRPDVSIQVAEGQVMHAAAIRLSYNGPDKPEVSLQIRSLDIPDLPVNSKVFPSQLTTKGILPNRYNALLFLLQEDGTPPTLTPAGRYRLTITVKANGGKIEKQASFEVNVTPTAP